MSKVLTFHFWDSETDREVLVERDLESVIRNPSGLRLETIGLHLLNEERAKRGLSSYAHNAVTGTYDET